ncbi:GFA family protein [Arenibaculum pallidiluteum]|uniref:GFA family protein n=1 Tax=Arenibaculum pallidiluteum TaxID=2812559 RepID=UPI001A970E98|nr:GFA family protein [Arenibaculum pallidiluteum]
MSDLSSGGVLEGGCQCGRVRYEIRGRPVGIYVCHCRECRKQSASAFGISVMVRSADLVLLSGTPGIWTRAATVGVTLDCAFCPSCGSRLWHGDRHRDAVVSVKGGSLDAPLDLSGAIHIWTSRKLPGVVIPAGAETHSEEPPA